LVVVFHATQTRFAVGAAGVDLFFVISGFIMATIAPGRTPTRFLADRAWRIFPLWFVAVAPWIAVFHNSAGQTLASLTLWPIYQGKYYFPYLGVGWTLSFECLFYLAVAVALRTTYLLPLSLFVACMGGSFLFGGDALSFLGSPLILEFIGGVVIAKLPRKAPLAMPCLVAALICLLIAPTHLYLSHVAISPQFVMDRVLFWGIPAMLVVYAALSAERSFGAPWIWPLVLLGDASYSIYLFHQLPLNAFDLSPWLAILVAIGTGLSIYLLIERRLLALRPPLRVGSPIREQVIFARGP